MPDLDRDWRSSRSDTRSELSDLAETKMRVREMTVRKRRSLGVRV
jgi:hypothetical protein